MTIERENLRWIYRAAQDLTQDMKRQNDNIDMGHHSALKGAVFRRPAFKEQWYGGLAYFASFGLLYSYFPMLAGILGWNTANLATYGTLLAGLVKIHEKNMVNSIKVLEEGDFKGWVKFNVSTSPFTSRTFMSKFEDVQAIASMHQTVGEEDPLLNTIVAHDAVDSNGNEIGD